MSDETRLRMRRPVKGQTRTLSIPGAEGSPRELRDLSIDTQDPACYDVLIRGEADVCTRDMTGPVSLDLCDVST